MNSVPQIVQRVWNYCNVLRDDGLSYMSYVTQLTYLIFLKMADEQSKPPFSKPSKIPKGLDWDSLKEKSGDELDIHYRHTLQELSKQKGVLSVIFSKARNEITDPAKLKRLIHLIDSETWSGMDVDVKGGIYEGLLQKNSEETKSGAGQYFTPRPLIQAMVNAVAPKPGETIHDPACGTGGFLLAAHDYIAKNYELNKDQKAFLKQDTFSGVEIASDAARLGVMNLYLHGIGGDESPIEINDSLLSDPGKRFDIVLTNPPFGKKSSVTITNEEGKADKASMISERGDFWTTTSNKQLNFLQHIKTILKVNGRAAVVLPDNVLFEGGAGETIRKKLLKNFDVHTILRLPTGIFYAQGVKSNVIFFDKKPASDKPWTKRVWFYDLRTNKHFTLKTSPLSYKDLEDFIKCYNPKNRHERQETKRFKSFTYEELMKRDKFNLDIIWLKDKSLEDLENLPEPEEVAKEIAEELGSALEEIKCVLERLES